MTSRKRSSDQQDAEDTQAKKSRVSYKGAPTKTDSNGDQYWEVSKMRRVTVSKFRGRTMVNVREYYEKDGQELPGKKGISLPVEQFAALVKLLPDIEQALEQQGESLPRPEYFDNTAQGHAAEGSDEEMDGKVASPSKQNIDATSDEESEA
ncbi:RNA polymerase II transcriptional coactivator KELP [Penicillium waksmanii]|uniref:RNA polymerase II transcriptional coactivator KELP n=1 Tax=Penicillium waksmanii TaxID=69791 RepID=UPI002547902F|nr:RNA polymerase II transcriptional coactivator KELP [Penicillium waksmanii]KAJ5988289.1 RNA polymerase II transcriptional coactivator KELP [Penicillium waksmanii]